MSSEMSVDFQRTTWRRIPEYSALHNHRRENRKSYIRNLFRTILVRKKKSVGTENS
jgi:hypothetical protein